jgi:hypothetical protein
MDRMTCERPSRLIEMSSPSGERGFYLCRACYERPGREPVRDDQGQEFCRVHRGESDVYGECMAPDHGKR